MKNIIIFFVLISGATFAQTDSYFELLRSDVKTEKISVITDVMKFNDQEAEVFWPIYREYEFERTKLGDKKYNLLKKYAENYENMSDDTAEEILLEAFDVSEERIDIKRKYYKKLSEVLSKRRAAQFMQLDNQIDLVIDLQVHQEIPLLDELSK